MAGFSMRDINAHVAAAASAMCDDLEIGIHALLARGFRVEDLKVIVNSDFDHGVFRKEDKGPFTLVNSLYWVSLSDYGPQYGTKRRFDLEPD